MTTHRPAAPAGGRWASCPSSTPRTACRPRMRWASPSAARDGDGRGRKIAVLAYPRIANFDDFDPLRLEQQCRPGVPAAGRAAAGRCRAGRSCPARRPPSPISPRCGRRAGTSTSRRIVRRGGHVLGICGGYQMLGRQDLRSRRHRGAAGQRRRAGPARRRDRARRRQDAGRDQRRDRRRRGALQGLRDAYRPHDRQQSRRCCASPTARSDGAVRRRAAASPAATSTACWPTTGSGSHWLQAHRRARARCSTTRPRSRRPSTRSPTTSRSYIDCDRLLGAGARAQVYQNRQRDRGDRDRARRSETAGDAVEIERARGYRARCIRCGRRPPSGSPIDAVVDARAGEPDAERAGHRGLGPAGIGRAVMAGVADARSIAPPRRAAPRRQRGGQHEPEGREPRGRQVHEIVEARRGPAEGEMTRSDLWPIMLSAVLTAL